jgi:hypothetical protein
MEARVAVLGQMIDTRFDRMESRLERIEDRQSADFKWRLGCGLGAVAFLFATMSHGFHWL